MVIFHKLNLSSKFTFFYAGSPALWLGISLKLAFYYFRCQPECEEEYIQPEIHRFVSFNCQNIHQDHKIPTKHQESTRGSSGCFCIRELQVSSFFSLWFHLFLFKPFGQHVHGVLHWSSDHSGLWTDLAICVSFFLLPIWVSFFLLAI